MKFRPNRSFSRLPKNECCFLYISKFKLFIPKTFIMFSRKKDDDRPRTSRVFADPRAFEGHLVKAKPIDSKLARRLGGHRGKDFVTATDTYADFASGYEVIDDEDHQDSSTEVSTAPSLSTDELNKLNAKILKAELMGDQETVKRLKAQITAAQSRGKGQDDTKEIEKPSSSSNDVLLTRTDLRSGLSMPVREKREEEAEFSKKKKMKVNMDQDAHLTVKELVEQERAITAEDQLAMFGAMSAKAATSQKLDDDTTVDDVFMSKRTNSKAEAKERAKSYSRAVEEHKRYEQTLESCQYCIDSRKLLKHLIVATGLKTYLSVPALQSLVDNHCCIVPMMHVSSTLQLDEDVYDEMKIWRKGLVAMFADQDEDCIFIETAKYVEHQKHMMVECIPVPKEVGEMAPIYFKKAILECDEEWAQNKRLIDLSEKGIRRSIPKGFSYFAVDFGLQAGFAHVIENESLFPANFAREVIGNVLDLDHNLWRKPTRESFEEQVKKMQKLKDLWTPYDWTERVKNAVRQKAE